MEMQRVQEPLNSSSGRRPAQRRASDIRRPSVSIALTNGVCILDICDPMLTSVSNQELPPPATAAPPSRTDLGRRWGQRLLACATLAYALWSIVNYVAPRGSGGSGMPRNPDWEFDR